MGKRDASVDFIANVVIAIHRGAVLEDVADVMDQVYDMGKDMAVPVMVAAIGMVYGLSKDLGHFDGLVADDGE